MGQGDPGSHSLPVRKMVAIAWMFGASSLPREHDLAAPTLLCIAFRWALQDEAAGKPWSWEELRQQLYTNIQPPPAPETRASLDAFDGFPAFFATMRQKAVAQGVDLMAFSDGLRDCQAIVAELPPPPTSGPKASTPSSQPGEPPRKKGWQFWK